MTTIILTNTKRFGAVDVTYPDHWSMRMVERDAQLINPAGDLAATFTDPVFCSVVVDMLNGPAVPPSPAPAPELKRVTVEDVTVEDVIDLHDLLEAANEMIDRQSAEIRELRGYLRLITAVALQGTASKNGSSVAPVSVPVAANCDPASVGFPPPAEAGIDLSTDGTDGADGTHEAEVPA